MEKEYLLTQFYFFKRVEIISLSTTIILFFSLSFKEKIIEYQPLLYNLDTIWFPILLIFFSVLTIIGYIYRFKFLKDYAKNYQDRILKNIFYVVLISMIFLIFGGASLLLGDFKLFTNLNFFAGALAIIVIFSVVLSKIYEKV